MAWILFGVHVAPFGGLAPRRFNAAAISGNESPVAENSKTFRSTSATRCPGTEELPNEFRAEVWLVVGRGICRSVADPRVELFATARVKPTCTLNQHPEPGRECTHAPRLCDISVQCSHATDYMIDTGLRDMSLRRPNRSFRKWKAVSFTDGGIQY